MGCDVHSVKLKEFMALKNLPYLFDHVIPNLKHENDGLIFTPVKLPYIPGTCRQLYALFVCRVCVVCVVCVSCVPFVGGQRDAAD
jgi:hypothetical protein